MKIETCKSAISNNIGEYWDIAEKVGMLARMKKSAKARRIESGVLYVVMGGLVLFALTLAVFIIYINL